jgi:hypothetical protein
MMRRLASGICALRIYTLEEVKSGGADMPSLLMVQLAAEQEEDK